MTPPELDAETKARIEAEEAYRAQVRQQAAQPPPSEPAESKRGPNWAILAIIVIIGVFYLVQSGGLKSLTAAMPVPQRQAVGAELQVQDTPDNYGIDMYLTLKDAGGSEVATAGMAYIEIYSRHYDQDPQLLWSNKVGIRADQFSRGTRGQGAFQRNAVFAHLGSVTTANLGAKSGDSVDVQLRYELLDDTNLSAKETSSVP